MRDNHSPLATWFRSRRALGATIQRQGRTIRNQRADLAQMHTALADAKSRYKWALKQARRARAAWWHEAERRYDTTRRSVRVHEENDRLRAIHRRELAPWEGKRFRVANVAPSHKHGRNRTVHIAGTGRCAVCRDDSRKLTNHHVFGRTIPLVIRACADCHEGFHRELVHGRPGVHTMTMTRAVADAFEELHAGGRLQHVS